MDCKIQDRNDYSKELLCYEAKVKIRYYTRQQMKALYPHSNFRVSGEIGNRAGIQCGVAENFDGQPLPVYKEKTHNSLTEAVIGYAAVDSHTYLAVVNSDLLKKIVILALALIFFAACLAVIFGYPAY